MIQTDFDKYVYVCRNINTYNSFLPKIFLNSFPCFCMKLSTGPLQLSGLNINFSSAV
uniref:Uncharacterized protein n=1 Tax=Lepeophtheirus salmonis TaxID=72036 RepID=A0A0K2UZE7_LEPSM